MDKNSVFGEIIEKGQNTVSNTVSNTTTSAANDISQTVAEQIGIKPKSQTQPQATGQNPPQAVVDNVSSPNTSEATKEIVEDFYAPTDNNSNTSSNPSASEGLDTQQKLAKVRQELLEQHKTEYYDPLFAYESKKAEPTKAEIVEQEEYKKMQELALSQQKKSEDIALQKAKTAVEANRGVAG